MDSYLYHVQLRVSECNQLDWNSNLAFRFCIPNRYRSHDSHIVAYCTWYSQVVTRIVTNHAQYCLTSVIVRGWLFQRHVAVSSTPSHYLIDQVS